jgi:hypothetical protein
VELSQEGIEDAVDPTFWATLAGTLSATAAVIVASIGIRRQLKQNYMIAGAQAAIVWRQQVIELHDRGLTAGEIRYIMHLERGGKGYEQDNGLIDEVLRNVPRRSPADLSALPEDSSRRSLPSPTVTSWNGEN